MTPTVDRIAEPETLLLTVEDARRHCLAIDDEDGYLADLIAAAQEEIEVSVRRALTVQTLRAVYEGFPCDADPLYLPRPPLVSVETITYVDEDGVSQAIDVDTETYVNTSSTPGAVLPISGMAGAKWPKTQAGRSVVVEFTAGYTTPPARAKHACRLLVGHWYLMREAVAVGVTPSSVPDGFRRILGGLKWGDYS
jgi:uncharacterized phiE125 gp8 family phage protein